MRYSLKGQDEIFSNSFQANMNETSLKNKLTGWIPSAQDHRVTQSKLQSCIPLQIVLRTTVSIVMLGMYILCNMLSNMFREMQIWTSMTSALLEELGYMCSTLRLAHAEQYVSHCDHWEYKRRGFGVKFFCSDSLQNNMSWICIPFWWIEAAEFPCTLCVDYNMQYIMPVHSALLYLLMNLCWAKNISKLKIVFYFFQLSAVLL